MIFLSQIKTRTNFDELVRVVSLRLTEDEHTRLEVISRALSISVSEVIRNLIRDHEHEYTISKNLAKYLLISNEIDKFLLEKRLIFDRKATNLSKMREILSDFEVFLEQKPSLIDIYFAKEECLKLNNLINTVKNKDEWLFSKIEKQIKRIWKNKVYKELDYTVDSSFV